MNFLLKATESGLFQIMMAPSEKHYDTREKVPFYLTANLSVNTLVDYYKPSLMVKEMC